ncbi:TetR/AcrR family transcriptional regulator [Kineosporia mesophila]|uniref:TetR/AcrR family transcriptional regulator n=1 Tax=Kineosporia mesophila TaxID=566012 RepID=A0ABP6Z5H4_9ACTN|nr:TetR/AcrR family transcriptional regulator [Kineosporia mesophila]MCD5352569.1 TetR/AcrR family transcriptional regulator [Kineosporia mesophila]
MAQISGTTRPGGRTAQTRQTVHDAVRALLAEPGAELTIPAVAERSGVHATTLYRRWRTVEALLLDLAVEDVTLSSPVPATGIFRADLDTYVRTLLEDLRQPGNLALLRAMLATANGPDGLADVGLFIAPRLAQFQTMLTAADITCIDALRLVEIVIAPAYLWAQFGRPMDPAVDTERLVSTVMAVVNAPEPDTSAASS